MMQTCKKAWPCSQSFDGWLKCYACSTDFVSYTLLNGSCPSGIGSVPALCRKVPITPISYSIYVLLQTVTKVPPKGRFSHIFLRNQKELKTCPEEAKDTILISDPQPHFKKTFYIPFCPFTLPLFILQ